MHLILRSKTKYERLRWKGGQDRKPVLSNLTKGIAIFWGYLAACCGVLHCRIGIYIANVPYGCMMYNIHPFRGIILSSGISSQHFEHNIVTS